MANGLLQEAPIQDQEQTRGLLEDTPNQPGLIPVDEGVTSSPSLSQIQSRDKQHREYRESQDWKHALGQMFIQMGTAQMAKYSNVDQKALSEGLTSILNNRYQKQEFESWQQLFYAPIQNNIKEARAKLKVKSEALMKGQVLDEKGNIVETFDPNDLEIKVNHAIKLQQEYMDIAQEMSQKIQDSGMKFGSNRMVQEHIGNIYKNFSDYVDSRMRGPVEGIKLQSEISLNAAREKQAKAAAKQSSVKYQPIRNYKEYINRAQNSPITFAESGEGRAFLTNSEYDTYRREYDKQMALAREQLLSNMDDVDKATYRENIDKYLGPKLAKYIPVFHQKALVKSLKEMGYSEAQLERERPEWFAEEAETQYIAPKFTRRMTKNDVKVTADSYKAYAAERVRNVLSQLPKKSVNVDRVADTVIRDLKDQLDTIIEFNDLTSSGYDAILEELEKYVKANIKIKVQKGGLFRDPGEFSDQLELEETKQIKGRTGRGRTGRGIL